MEALKDPPGDLLDMGFTIKVNEDFKIPLSPVDLKNISKDVNPNYSVNIFFQNGEMLQDSGKIKPNLDRKVELKQIFLQDFPQDQMLEPHCDRNTQREIYQGILKSVDGLEKEMAKAYFYFLKRPFGKRTPMKTTTL